MRLFDSQTIINFFKNVSVVVAICTAITAITPNKTDDKIMQKVRNILDIFAGNVGHNLNCSSSLVDNSCAQDVCENNTIVG